MQELKKAIETLYDNPAATREDAEETIETFLNALDAGNIRAAEKTENGEWIANEWVKKGVLLVFKFGVLKDMSINSSFKFFDKDFLTLKAVSLEDKIRLVPGGSAIRRGAFVAKGAICMPPMYVNVGARVEEGSMIDSHALVGTCAQIGKGVHLSAASQIGGVLEPPGARPVIVEDNVMIGGNCGIYEGVLIRKRAVLGSGTILTSSTKVFDLVEEKIISASPEKPLEIPEGAVVVPGSRTLKSDFARENGLSLYAPVIVKYRDEKTDANTALESALR